MKIDPGNKAVAATPSPELDQRLEVALAAALKAGKGAWDAWIGEGQIRVELKPDGSHVTNLDRWCERVIREAITAAFPNDGILGEEYGESPGQNGYRWIIDPIDGTTMFTLGIPAWGVLVGLELNGKPVLGVAAIPPLDEIAFARHGGGCFWLRGIQHCAMPQIQVRATAKRVQMSDTLSLKDAFGITCTLRSWEKAGFGDGHEKIRRAMRRCQNGGFNCYNYVMLVSGRVGLAFDPIMKPWDLAALAPLVVEAGGVYSDLHGNETIHGGSFIAGTPRLHREAMALFIDK